MQHGITGITCGAGTVSWTAHRPPGSFSNSSFIYFLSSAIGQSHSLLAYRPRPPAWSRTTLWSAGPIGSHAVSLYLLDALIAAGVEPSA